MTRRIAVDGLEALKAEIGLGQIASLIERTAQWVAPETFSLLPLWFPEHARRHPFYKNNWSEPQMNRNRTTGSKVHKLEGNVHANKALTLALGLRSTNRPNWSCCHIWGIDDPTFQRSNEIVSDHRFFSCVGNMVLLPTPLKAFTDTMPEIKTMLRVCASHLYRWQCDHESLMDINKTIDEWSDWSGYPASWPAPGNPSRRPLGLIELTDDIRRLASQRLARIRSDLVSAGEYYPRDAVRTALAYWKLTETA